MRNKIRAFWHIIIGQLNRNTPADSMYFEEKV